MVNPMTIRRLFVLAFACCLVVPGIGQAQQRPLVTEDPETIGADRVLVEGGFEIDKDQLYSAYGLKGDTTHIATFGVSVGISPIAEIQLDGGLLQRLNVTERLASAPLASARDLIVGDKASSLEDFTVATKVRLAPETQSRPAFGVRFGTKLPTAKHQTAMGLGTTDFFVSALIGKTVQSVRTVGNVGLVVMGNPGGAQEPIRAMAVGVSVARAVTNAFELVGEINGRLRPMGDAEPPGLESRGVLKLAGRYTYSLFRLDFGLLVGLTPRDPSFGITAGGTYVITR
jgi:hypothetical protein